MKNWIHLSNSMFTPGVMAIKISKVAYFLYLLLMAAKNQSQFGQNISAYLKDFIWLF